MTFGYEEIVCPILIEQLIKSTGRLTLASANVKSSSINRSGVNLVSETENETDYDEQYCLWSLFVIFCRQVSYISQNLNSIISVYLLSFGCAVV